MIRRRLAGWRARSRQAADQWTRLRAQWEVEYELERSVNGDEPILAGPWISEVGYEVMYWAPFLRWVTAAYRIPRERLVVMSRGGTESWYGGIASRYLDVFDYAEPRELAARAAAGVLKQRERSPLDERLIEEARNAIGGRRLRVLHPSLMFRWFAPFWSGQQTLSFVETHTRHEKVIAPAVDVPFALPAEYVAVKFYAARSLPDEPAVRAQVRAVVESLAGRYPVVHLDTGLGVDDHIDYRLEASAVTSVRDLIPARTNLAAQAHIIAGARMFVGTCGSLAWLAPLLGVPTLALFSDAAFLHAHLHVARRVYERTGAARFSPMDLAGILDAGLAIRRAEPQLIGGPAA